ACLGWTTRAGSRSATPPTSSSSTTTWRSNACSWVVIPVSPHDLAVAQTPGSSGPGTQFLAEIKEQPQALLDLLQHRSDFERVAATMRERSASLVRLVGHGSSDNAASYAVYAFGLEPRWTALR